MLDSEKREIYDDLSFLYDDLDFLPSDDSNALNKPLNDKWQTAEQKNRDEEITKLLKGYVRAYNRKAEFQYDAKRTLLIIISMAIAFLIVSFGLTTFFAFYNGVENFESLAGVLSICVTFAGLIFGAFNVIVRYVFPEDDEKYITEIVKVIQNNDLANKKQNIEASHFESDPNKTE